MGEMADTVARKQRGKVRWSHELEDALEDTITRKGIRVTNYHVAIIAIVFLIGGDIVLRATAQFRSSQNSAGETTVPVMSSVVLQTSESACPRHCLSRAANGEFASPVQLPCLPVPCQKGEEEDLEPQDAIVSNVPERLLPRKLQPLDLPDTPIFFLATDPDPYSIVCIKLARIYSPRSPLYVLTTRYAVAHARFHELLHVPNVHFKMLEHYFVEGSDSDEFHKDYIHQSVTQIKFERLCFIRYFVIRDVCQEEGIQRFLYMDGDVALFSDVAEFASFDVDLLALTTHSGFFSLWRLPTFERFCAYMASFYKRDKEAVFQDINKYGMKMNETFVQFSDMFMMFSWWQQHADFSWKFLVHDSKAFQEGFFKYWPMMNLQNIIGWDCLEKDYREKMEWRKDDQGKPVPHFNGTTFPGLHFQGFYCKNLSRYILDPIIEEWLPVRTHSADPSVRIESPLQKFDLNPGLPPVR